MPTTQKTNEPALDAANRQIVITRLFDAPPEKIFELFTDPKHLVHWWGPGGDVFVDEFDFRVGGSWKIRGDCGPGNHFVYTRIERPNHLEWEQVIEPRIKGVVTIKPVGGKAEMTARMIFPTVEIYQQAAQFGAGEVLSQSFDRMAAYIAAA